MTDDELTAALDRLRGLLTTVATGGARIDDVNDEYQATFRAVATELGRRRIDNPITFETLWEWHGRWSSGDLPTWKSRRLFVAELINPLVQRIRTNRADVAEPTGWQRVDRGVGELRDRFAEARSEEQFQAVGLLGREALISLAQAVYLRERHPPLDGVEPSATDAKRMLEAYIAVELAGGPNEELRRHAKSALELAVALQHRRTATFRDAALCVEGTTAVVNVIAIVAGRRNRQPDPVKKFVDIRYAADSGIQRRLEEGGYTVGWCKESELARKIDIEGAELVSEPDAHGVVSTYHVKDRLGDLALIKRKNNPRH